MKAILESIRHGSTISAPALCAAPPLPTPTTSGRPSFSRPSSITFAAGAPPLPQKRSSGSKTSSTHWIPPWWTCAWTLFPWASFRSTKAGIKVHTLLDHDGYIPAFVQVTDAKTADIAVARTLSLPARSIMVVNRAFVDFVWFAQWHRNRQFFVTRMKNNIHYKVVERRSVRKSSGITSDQIISLTGAKAASCPIALRRVGYRSPKTKKHYVFLTNIFHLCAKTIADIYKERWQVELFLNWINQNLKIKSFLATSKNAVLTQIWGAMITLLLLAFYKWRAKLGHSMTDILKLLQLTLFERRNLYELFEPPLIQHESAAKNQLCLHFNRF
ncbi:IS4 family transposase [Thermodesulfobacteriota bacterium]